MRVGQVYTSLKKSQSSMSFVNQPVVINGKQGRYLGVCRFHGSTAFKEGIWCGVELDRPIGKNDGSVKGVRYFNCKPKCGLFARAGTVQLAPNNTTAQVRASPAQQRQQHQQYPAPAPAPVQQQPPQQQIQPKQPTHFQIAASAFCFRKDTNQWSELGTGTVRLYTGSDQKVHLDSAGAQTSLNHTVETGTKLEPNVGSDRAWVFRATNAASFAGDVIALQFGDPMAAQRFADAFEDLTIGLETAPAPPAPQAKSNAAPQAPAQQQQQQHTTTQASKPPMRQQRRRLSVVGDNVNIDGRRASGFAAQPEEPTILKGHSGVAGTVIGEYSGMSKKGYAPYNGKKENQDVCFMHQDPATNSMLFATFDGHGQYGHLVSRYFQRHLCDSVVKHPSWTTNPAKAMRDCMLAREKELCQGRAVDTSLSGTTAVFALVRGDELTVLNAGDSRLILGVRDSASGRIVPKEITHDNKPDNPLEQARIEANGGRVWAMKYDDGIDGPARVWLKDQNIPGLAMSRSLCDEVAKQAGVISEPEVYREKLGSEVVYLCMATDGLWEFLSNREVVDMINQFGQDPQAAINLMMKTSEALWRKNEEVVDDTSIILAYLTDM